MTTPEAVFVIVCLLLLWAAAIGGVVWVLIAHV